MLNKHVYEKTLNFNFITKFLHRTRFRNLEKLIIRVSKEKKGKLKIIDVGCGPAEAYKTITKLGIDFVYIGVELRKDFCDIGSQRYSQFENFTIIHDSIENQFEKFTEADVIIGLESFEHIPEWLVVRTIEAISKASFMYLYITVPNEVGPAIFVKNVGSALMGYNRYKEYEWRETFFASIYELDKVKRHDSGHKGFDWRWLAQTLRQNVTIVKKTSSPADFIPKFISPSVGFICVKSESRESEVIDLGVDFGFVEKAGAWYSVDGERIGQSKDNARDYLKEHSETCQLLEEKIREKKAGVKI